MYTLLFIALLQGQEGTQQRDQMATIQYDINQLKSAEFCQSVATAHIHRLERKVTPLGVDVTDLSLCVPDKGVPELD